MREQAESNPARILVPLALVVVAVAFFAVILTSGGDDGERGDENPTAQERRASTDQRRREPSRSRASYTVKTGDTLAGIAQKTGVSVEQLQELNPELDPQALVSGQKLKLR